MKICSLSTTYNIAWLSCMRKIALPYNKFLFFSNEHIIHINPTKQKRSIKKV